MINKKAEIIAEEVLKIVLAVIGIVLLLILAFQLYGMFINKTDIEQAKATLKQIKGRIDSLEEGESDKMLITSPKGWALTSYDNRLCICYPDSVKSNLDKESLIKDCVEKGVCEENINVKIDSICGFREGKIFEPVERCYNIDVGNLYLSKNERVVIKSQHRVDEEKLFSDFLSIENSKGENITNLSKEYVYNQDDESLHKEVEELVEKSFKENEIEDGFFIITEGMKSGESYSPQRAIFSYSYPDDNRMAVESEVEETKYIVSFEGVDYGVNLETYKSINEK